MDDLIKMVSEKAGIPEEAARIAVQVVVGFLKDKLPPPFSGQLDGIISGDVDANELLGGLTGGAGGLGGMLGGLFGGKK